jgi:hypothetical protein
MVGLTATDPHRLLAIVVVGCLCHLATTFSVVSAGNLPVPKDVCLSGGAPSFASAQLDNADIKFGVGQSSMTCLASTVTGLYSLSSFRYNLSVDSAVSMTAMAHVVDVLANNAVIASVDISSQIAALVPSTDMSATATFASDVTLDPSGIYFLAFCATGASGADEYVKMRGFAESTSFSYYCNDEYWPCPSTGDTWVAVFNYFNRITFALHIDGSCSPPASSTPSPSVSPSSLASPSPSPLPLTCCVGPQRCI